MLIFLMNASEHLNFDIKLGLPIMGSFIHFYIKQSFLNWCLYNLSYFRLFRWTYLNVNIFISSNISYSHV